MSNNRGDPAASGLDAAPALPLDRALGRATEAFRALDERLAGAGGLAPVVALYDRVRDEVRSLEYADLDRVATEIRAAIEALLRMDAAVRKLNNLKVMFDREAPNDAD